MAFHLRRCLSGGPLTPVLRRYLEDYTAIFDKGFFFSSESKHFAGSVVAICCSFTA